MQCYVKYKCKFGLKKYSSYSVLSMLLSLEKLSINNMSFKAVLNEDGNKLYTLLVQVNFQRNIL